MSKGYDVKDGITICICTFRRESLFETIVSLFSLQREGLPPLSILIADNDEHDGLRGTVEDFAAQAPIPVRYVHAPFRNISIARNACLETADTRWAAFIDDDEVAKPDWLQTLYRHAPGNNAVIGDSVAVYGSDLPGWLAKADFHSNRITGQVENAYTSNALLDLDFVHANALRFRKTLGQTGGEDTIFFKQFALAGGKIVYVPKAVVFETVTPGRATMKWVLKRAFRSGQTHGELCRDFMPPKMAALPLTSSAKSGFSAVMALATIPGTARSRRWLARSVFHAGALSYSFRRTILKEYG